MKKILIISFTLALVFSTYAQDQVKSLIDEGVSLHDKGDYSGAIKKYDKALEIDENNITALAEKAYSLFSLQDYNASISICQLAMKRDPHSPSLKFVFTTYANALDALSKPNEAIEIYNQGIELFPDYYQLYFNKGVTLSSLQEFEKAELSFQNAVLYNPEHASSHNALARISLINKTNIPALLAFGRFFVEEPQGARAKLNLPFIKKLMSANVERTGENSVTINIDSNMLNSDNEEKKANDFSAIELMLSMAAALDYEEKNKGKTEVELFIEKFKNICATLKDVKHDNFGFYWEYYAPYFINMKESDLIEPFAYLVYASSEDQYVQEWLNKNDSKIEEFYNWSSKFQWKTN